MTKMDPPSIDNHDKLYKKYFHDIRANSFYYKPEVFNEDELQALLQSYGLKSFYPVFNKLARLATSFQASWIKGDSMVTGLDELFNKEIDLINLAKSLKEEKVKWLELRPNVGDTIRLEIPFYIVQLGDAILTSLNRPTNIDELPDLEKAKKNRGRHITSLPIGFMIKSILDFLNNETSLKSGKARITIKQEKFISEFLVFAKVIDPEKYSVLDEDYIRMTLNNYLTAINK